MLRTTARQALKAAAVAVCLAAGVSGLVVPAAAGAGPHPGRAAASPVLAGAELSRAGGAARSRFCQNLGTRYWGSAGALALCEGPQPHGPSGPGAHAPAAGKPVPMAPGNADAASPAEDVSPSGTRAYGQSNVSIAASGPYVVEAWNDATRSFAACPSPKAQGTGLGFSSDGGKTFTDLQGPPDAKCSQDRYEGDPSVVAYRAGGHTYFYVSSMFDPSSGSGSSDAALAACQVAGPGSRASLRCGQPVITAASTQCRLERFGGRTFKDCNGVDKPFVTIDPARGRLYTAYTAGSGVPGFDTIQVSVCDLGTPAGRPGPAGGTPAAPACKHGTPLHKVSKNMLAGKPYLTIQQPDRPRRGCQFQGASPAADTASGDLYVGYEFNFLTSIYGGASSSPSSFDCLKTPVRNIVTQVPRHCLALRRVSPCAGPAAKVSVPITSISTAILPGYIPHEGLQTDFANDFPRLAVSDRAGTVSMTWNDTRFHPHGDILLQSFTLRSLHPVQRKPVVLDTPHHGGLTFMPAVRTATAAGLLDVSWYSRDSVITSYTTVKAALGVSPRASRTPASNITITNVASNWDNQNYDFIPNFGDYTDNALTATSTKPYVGSTLYIAWTDGRTGVPQPFEAHLPAHRGP